MTQASLETPAQSVLHWARVKPHAIAVEEGGQPYSWQELAQHVAQAHGFLLRAGVRPGMLVALHCPNRYLNLLLLLAAEVAGAIHASLSNDDLVPDHPVVARAQLLCLVGPAPALAGDARVVLLDGAWLAATMAAPLGPQGVAVLAMATPPELGVRLGWTSGTTGQPKYMLNTRAQVTAMLNVADVACRSVQGGHLTYICFYGPTVRGVYLDIIRALQAGNRVFFVQEGGGLGSAQPLDRAYAFLLPRQAEALAAACVAEGLFLNLYYIDVVGSMMTPALHARLHATLSHHIFSVYSSNETNVIAMAQPDGTARVAPFCEVRIVDPEGRPLPPGEVGLVQVRSARVVEGYLWDPVLTARHFRDGWFTMSDLATMPEPGLLHLLGRADDMLNIAGVKLAPYPLEDRLKALSGISDALLLSRPNALGVGELLVVVERPLPADDAALLAQVEAVVQQDIAPFAVHFATSLPRTPTGKPRREEVLRRLAAGEAV